MSFIKRFWLPFFYILVVAGYAWFSYGLVAPNLVLSSWPPFWQWQQFMWQTFFNQRHLATQVFVSVVTLLLVSYWLLSRQWSNYNHHLKLSLIGLSFLLATLANNALSYDVFNYMFNARMMVIYQANPHVQVALNFADDPWTRFMHNTHTPAPYGYGWTVLSLIPYSLGFSKLILTWEAFRLFSVLSLLGLLATYFWIARHNHDQRIWHWGSLLALHPLLLVEIITNSHNDLWMMVPAVISLSIMAKVVTQAQQLKVAVRGSLLATSLVLLVASISIKLATVVLLPIWCLLLLLSLNLRVRDKLWPQVRSWWPIWASLALFVPLLTARSQQFHPWYLTWSLAWLPLLTETDTKPGTLRNLVRRSWIVFLLGLSVSSLYRYVPWLWSGGFDGDVVWQQKMITWVLPSLLALIYALYTTLRQLNFPKKTANSPTHSR